MDQSFDKFVGKKNLLMYNLLDKQNHNTRRFVMKPRKSKVQSKAHSLPDVKFENQALTSFAGLIILQKFFAAMNLKQRLQNCFIHLNNGKIFNRATLFLQLIVHVILGYRELQDSRYYQDDPLVKRLLGLNQLPDVATVSRALKQADAQSVESDRKSVV